MKRSIIALTGLVAGALASADNVSEADRLLCSTSKVQICLETGDCYPATPWEIGVPQFVIIDTDRKVMKTTEASEENRSTPIANMTREDGRLVVQGFEQGRAFSVVIDEALGAFTAAIARDGISVSAFGSCTDTDKL